MSVSIYVAAENGGSSYFGGNSGRFASEPQVVCLVPRRDAAGSVTLDGVSFPVPERGYSYMMSRPEGTAGALMGVNERGVALGSAAMFSRFPQAREGVVGSVLLRAALASCETAKEAVDFICGWVEANGQCAGDPNRGAPPHDTGFIVGDPAEAYVAETAGKRWAWRKAERRDAISDAYSITEDYKRLDTQTRKEISPVNERAACSDEADPGRKGEKQSWRAHVEKKPDSRLAKGDERRALALNLIGAGRGGSFGSADSGPMAGIMTVFSVLRSHGEWNPAHPMSHRLESLCIHPGTLHPVATTASMALERRPDGVSIAWFTGSSSPCLSLYKPLLLAGGEFVPLWTSYDLSEESAMSVTRWEAHRSWMDRQGKSAVLDPAFMARRDAAQLELALIAAGAADECGRGQVDRRVLDVFRQEANAAVAGWEKDLD